MRKKASVKQANKPAYEVGSSQRRQQLYEEMMERMKDRLVAKSKRVQDQNERQNMLQAALSASNNNLSVPDIPESAFAAVAARNTNYFKRFGPPLILPAVNNNPPAVLPVVQQGFDIPVSAAEVVVNVPAIRRKVAPQLIPTSDPLVPAAVMANAVAPPVERKRKQPTECVNGERVVTYTRKCSIKKRKGGCKRCR